MLYTVSLILAKVKVSVEEINRNDANTSTSTAANSFILLFFDSMKMITLRIHRLALYVVAAVYYFPKQRMTPVLV